MKKWRVDVFEYERGWGNRLDFSKEFETYEEARTWQINWNADNDKDEVPDWYMMAADPVKFST